MARNGRGVKEKGTSGEREFAKKIGGQRIPLSGQTERYRGDVEGLGLKWEVKRRKSGFAKLYEWLSGEGIDALAVRADRKPWLVVMELDTFLRIATRPCETSESRWVMVGWHDLTPDQKGEMETEPKKEEGEESENDGSSHWMEECPKTGEPCTCKNECIYLRQKRG